MASRVVIVPGNGCGEVEKCNWYAWARDEIKKVEGLECTLKSMPDPVIARETIWIPFMHDQLCCDEKTIIVGHSSGAAAAMRYAEKYKIYGIILVSAYVNDLGVENERQSGYFSRPWEWELMKNNTQFITLFGSTDDPFIPWSEMQVIVDNLDPECHKFEERGHFMSSTFPELVCAIQKLTTH
ncbi:putative hydrolase RBBP9 [Acanthaster planci]|uniref:Hydrolase RBBP9 n=1 Tax=Acanthaster planci TaxID=133434 RepID=A0A8B7ZQ06_ACAPL|nr:putative hydrolase RBBP9 [Acanthaster planci]